MIIAYCLEKLLRVYFVPQVHYFSSNNYFVIRTETDCKRITGTLIIYTNFGLTCSLTLLTEVIEVVDGSLALDTCDSKGKRA